jgi:hypothetical protein
VRRLRHQPSDGADVHTAQRVPRNLYLRHVPQRVRHGEHRLWQLRGDGHVRRRSVRQLRSGDDVPVGRDLRQVPRWLRRDHSMRRLRSRHVRQRHVRHGLRQADLRLPEHHLRTGGRWLRGGHPGPLRHVCRGRILHQRFLRFGPVQHRLVRDARPRVRTGGERLRRNAELRNLHGVGRDVRRRRNAGRLRRGGRQPVRPAHVRRARDHMRPGGRRLRQPYRVVRDLPDGGDLRRGRNAREVRSAELHAAHLHGAGPVLRPDRQRMRGIPELRDLRGSSDLRGRGNTGRLRARRRERLPASPVPPVDYLRGDRRRMREHHRLRELRWRHMRGWRRRRSLRRADVHSADVRRAQAAVRPDGGRMRRIVELRDLHAPRDLRWRWDSRGLRSGRRHRLPAPHVPPFDHLRRNR